MRPYYEQDGITIYCGDCRDVLPSLVGVDLVITDPPWGVGKVERTYARRSGPAAAWDTAFDLSWAEDVSRLAPALALLPGVGNLGRCPDSIGGLGYRWTLAAHVVNGMTRSPIGFGNWIPCMVYAADGVRLYRPAPDVGQVSTDAHPSQKPAHPSPKPYRAMRWFLQRLPVGTVLDPFAGSGSTLLAAQLEGRRAIGVEIEERYCEIAANRLRQGVLPLEVSA